jgi:hypothetical protein
MESTAGVIDNGQPIELQSAGQSKGKGFPENGTAGLLRRSIDNEIGNPGHSAVLGARLMAESRSLGLEWLPSDLSFSRGAR